MSIDRGFSIFVSELAKHIDIGFCS